MKFREYLEDIPSIGSVYYVIDSRNNDIEQLFYEVTSIEDVKGGGSTTRAQTNSYGIQGCQQILCSYERKVRWTRNLQKN